MEARRFGAPGMIVMTIAVAILTSPAALSGRHSISISTEEAFPTRCDDIRVRFSRGGDDDLPMARAEEHRTLSGADADLLRLDLEGSSGVTVSGVEGDDVEVTVCKAAGAGTLSHARELVEGIASRWERGRLSVNGPQDEDWMVQVILRVPRDTVLELGTDHGPIGLHDVAGRVTTRTRNGPIVLKECSGAVDASTENGPIEMEEGEGRQRLSTRNGPVSVTLSDGSWRGEGLVATTDNGPLSVRVPDDFESGVRVTISGHAPFICHAAGCGSARESWDGGSRTLELGGPVTRVRLSTDNGPVSITPGSTRKDL